MTEPNTVTPTPQPLVTPREGVIQSLGHALEQRACWFLAGFVASVMWLNGLHPAPTPIPGPTPVPSPRPIPPKPQPAPAPKPVATGPLVVLCVYDLDALATLPPAQRDIRVSVTLADTLKGLDARLATVDKSMPDVTGWLSDCKSLPWLLVMDESGKLHASAALPATEADVVSLVKGLRGK